MVFFRRYSYVNFVQWEKSFKLEILLTERESTSTLFISRSTETFSNSLPHRFKFFILARRSVFARKRIKSAVSVFPIKMKNFKYIFLEIFLKILICSGFRYSSFHSDTGSPDSISQTPEVYSLASYTLLPS